MYHIIRWLFLLLGVFESGLERLLIFPSALLFVLLHFLFCAEDAVYIGTHGLEFFVIILEIMVSIVLGVLPFKNLLNDSYCRDISIKVRSQLDIKRRKGEFIGGYAVYGYSKDEQNKNRLVVDEYAADIVRSIYRRKLEGMSANSIADQLNSEGVLAPSEYKRLCGLNYHSGFKTGTHAKWQAIQVLRILKNEVYTGTMVQGKRQKINYKDAITLVSVI